LKRKVIDLIYYQFEGIRVSLLMLMIHCIEFVADSAGD